MSDTILGTVNNNTDDKGQENPIVQVQETPPTEPQEQGTPEAGTQTPEVPENYDFTSLGELDETIVAEFSEMLKGMGATQEQATQMAEYGIKYAEKAMEALDAVREKEQAEQVAAWEKETKEALGRDFEATVAKAGKAIEYLEKKVPNIREFFNENGIGNRIELVKVFAAIGEALDEDGGKGNGQQPSRAKSVADIMYPSK